MVSKADGRAREGLRRCTSGTRRTSRSPRLSGPSRSRWGQAFTNRAAAGNPPTQARSKSRQSSRLHDTDALERRITFNDRDIEFASQRRPQKIRERHVQSSPLPHFHDHRPAFPWIHWRLDEHMIARDRPTHGQASTRGRMNSERIQLRMTPGQFYECRGSLLPQRVQLQPMVTTCRSRMKEVELIIDTAWTVGRHKLLVVLRKPFRQIGFQRPPIAVNISVDLRLPQEFTESREFHQTTFQNRNNHRTDDCKGCSPAGTRRHRLPAS